MFFLLSRRFNANAGLGEGEGGGGGRGRGRGRRCWRGRVVGEVIKRTSRETSAFVAIATVFILFYVHTKLTNKVVLGALRHYIL